MSRTKNVILAGIVISLIFVIVGTLWLSNAHETLEEMAQRFAIKESPFWNPPLRNYESSYKGNLMWPITIGFVSALLVLGVTFIVAKGLPGKSKMELKRLC